MKPEDTKNKVAQMLHDFEALEPLESSNQWEQELFLKLSAAGRHNGPQLEGLKTIAIIIIFLFINGLAFFQSNHSDSLQTSERHALLQDISEQLLINSTASN